MGAGEQQVEKHGGLKHACTLCPGKLKTKSRVSAAAAEQAAGTREVSQGERHLTGPASLPRNHSPRTSQYEDSTVPASPWHGGAATFLALHQDPSRCPSARLSAPLRPTVVRGGPAAGSVRRSCGSHRLRFVKVLACPETQENTVKNLCHGGQRCHFYVKKRRLARGRRDQVHGARTDGESARVRRSAG